MRILTVGILLALWAYQICAQNPRTWPIGFPEHSRATSPDRRYALINVDNDTEPYHTVFLENRRLKTRRELFHYGRGVDVLWSPDSRSFALTDYAGSNYSLCSVIYVDEKLPAIDVWTDLRKRVAPSERRLMEGNDHVYIEAISWDGPKILKVKIGGYGEPSPNGFTRFYSYTIGGGIRREKPWRSANWTDDQSPTTGPFSYLKLHGKLHRVLVHSSSRFCDLREEPCGIPNFSTRLMPPLRQKIC